MVALWGVTCCSSKISLISNVFFLNAAFELLLELGCKASACPCCLNYTSTRYYFSVLSAARYS